jgi:hypothetical protein
MKSVACIKSTVNPDNPHVSPSLNTVPSRSSVDLRFFDNLPQKPYCTNDLSYGLKIRPKEKAIRFRYIQPNFPKILIYLMFDVDRDEAGASWIDASLPKPTFIVVNLENGHAHLIYELLTPVLLWDNASPKPIAYLDAIRRAYAFALGADLGYSSLITKNPSHSTWYTFASSLQYELGELADYVELPDSHYKQARGIREDYAALGRNCTLFEVGRFHAYDRVSDLSGQEKLYAVVLGYLSTYNATEFAESLPEREVHGIAISISKWTWERRENFKGRSGRHRRQTLNDEELRERHIQGAHSTNEIRKAATEAKIKKAVEKFLRLGRKITKAAIAREAGISREAASRYYSHLIPKV